eukprot:TRINITY_DN1356_c0_g1_i3.p1 TRINITY_DN1356_c0_g1~~TRINITY_DN1356_c0_g1_i3.p1  ORF type:complete len:138 (-),score=44.61 TRINITY_DN1356_c0_g1_i3:742-1155(-)
MPSLAPPARFRTPAGLPPGAIKGYAGVYGGGQTLPPAGGPRPPPPIQMYSMEESPDETEDHRGPIYDTINDDSVSGSSNNPPPSTFTPPSLNGYASSKASHNDYDLPEGSEIGGPSGGSGLRHKNSFGPVTINGIAV